jgi:hypothetical protein
VTLQQWSRVVGCRAAKDAAHRAASCTECEFVQRITLKRENERALRKEVVCVGFKSGVMGGAAWCKGYTCPYLHDYLHDYLQGNQTTFHIRDFLVLPINHLGLLSCGPEEVSV